MSAPNSTYSLEISSYKSRAVITESHVVNARFVDRLIVTSQSFIFVPKCEGAVEPADGKGLDLRVPLNLRDLSFAALDFEVWHDSALLTDENDSRHVCCYGENNVKVVV